MTKIKINQGNSYKIGVDEIEGLKAEMYRLMRPLLKEIKSQIYWNDSLKFNDSEYKSRDGFIAHTHNCGGPMLYTIIPKCEEYSFNYLEFGECDDSECDHESECSSDSEGYLDASLRIWFKFEGINEETEELEFYLFLSGGNGDAPYFRTKFESDVFEASFSCKSVGELKRVTAKPIKDLLKILKGESL